MALRLRRGTDAQRLLITPQEGELIYTTDTKRLWVGDGLTLGGVMVNTGAAYGLDDLVDVDLTLPPEAGMVLKYNGSVFVAATEGAITPGGDYFINVTNSTGGVILDSTLETFTGTLVGDSLGTHSGDVIGNVLGNVQGDVVALDSSTMVSSGTKTLTALTTNSETINGNVVVLSGTTTGGTKSGIRIDTDGSGNDDYDLFTIFSAHNDATTPSISSVVRARGTPTSPLPIQSGDPIFSNLYVGISSDSTPALAAQVIIGTEGVISAGRVPGTYTIKTANAQGNLVDAIVINSDQNVTFSNIVSAPSIISNFRGSFFGDDSSILVDGISGKITGPVDSISVNVRDSATFEYEGVVKGAVNADGEGNFSVVAQDYNLGLVSVGGAVQLFSTTGNVEAYSPFIATAGIEGDLTGSVFADNSTLLIDGITGNISANSVSFFNGASITNENNDLVVDSGTATAMALVVSGNTFVLGNDGSLTFPDDTVQTGAAISIAELKVLVAASADFDAFKTAIAAL